MHFVSFPKQTIHTGGQDRKQVRGYSFLEAPEFPVGSDTRGLLRHEFVPKESRLSKFFFNRSPCTRAPSEAITDWRAELNGSRLDFIPQVERRRGSKGNHLPIPTGRQVTAQGFHATEFADRDKMFGKIWLASIHSSGLN